ncbi:MAG: MlaE family lipid ABC transporter permease subunit [Sphingomonadales bacterium]|nr:MlaE family lipid ABC transporter permease subunit [Sphingomonadales bacterium]
MTEQSGKAWVESQAGGDRLTVAAGGRWDVAHLAGIEQELGHLPEPNGYDVTIDMAGIARLDTAGAWVIYSLEKRYREAGAAVQLAGATTEHRTLLKRAADNDHPCDIAPPEKNALIRQVEDVGVGTVEIATRLGALLSFLGLVLMRLFGCFRHPSRLRLTPLVHQMELVGLKALPIVGLLSFLIGAVIVNQGAIQLRTFGAEIFVVNMIAIAQLRELGILLTAIIIAGRSGSSFTAQIGSMVLHEEVDAMKTIGLNPIDVLVLPRMLALMIMLPFLAFYADIMGLVGGAIVAWVSLDITPAVFIARFLDAIYMTTFWVGIIKAPFFAAVIAVSGCFEGLNVRGTAESVGLRTTQSVVQSIFLVIVLDAAFAIFFTAIDW